MPELKKLERPEGIPIGPNNGGPIVISFAMQNREFSEEEKNQEILEQITSRILKEYPEANAFMLGEEILFKSGFSAVGHVAVQPYKI